MKREIIIAVAGNPNGTIGGIIYMKELNSSFGSYNTFTSSSHSSAKTGNCAEMDVRAGMCLLKHVAPKLSGTDVVVFIDYHVVFSKKVHKLRKFVRSLEVNFDCKIHLRLQDKQQLEDPSDGSWQKTSQFLKAATQLSNGTPELAEETEEQLRNVGLFRGHVTPCGINHLIMKTTEIFNAIFQLNGGVKRVSSSSIL